MNEQASCKTLNAQRRTLRLSPILILSSALFKASKASSRAFASASRPSPQRRSAPCSVPGWSAQFQQPSLSCFPEVSWALLIRPRARCFISFDANTSHGRTLCRVPHIPPPMPPIGDKASTRPLRKRSNGRARSSKNFKVSRLSSSASATSSSATSFASVDLD